MFAVGTSGLHLLDKEVSHRKGRSLSGAPTSGLLLVSCAPLGEARSFGYFSETGRQNAALCTLHPKLLLFGTG